MQGNAGPEGPSGRQGFGIRSRIGLHGIGGLLGWLVLGCILAVIVLLPLYYAVEAGLHEESRFGLLPQRSFTAFIDVYTNPEYLGTLWQSLRLSAIVTGLSMVVGVAIATLVARTDMPGKAILELLVIMPLFLSPFTGLIAWIGLGSARTGAINVGLQALFKRFGIQILPIMNIWSYGGLVWVMFLFSMPFVYLFTVGSLRSMDTSLEEAARTTGAGAFRTLLRVTYPICLPSILASSLLVFILTAETYTMPGVIGSNVGFTVLSWQVYEDSMQMPVHQAHAAAAGTMLLLATIIGVLIQRRLTRNAERFATVGGKGVRAAPMRLGRWKVLAASSVAFYALLSTVLPMADLVLDSLQKYESPSFALAAFSLDQYREILNTPDTRIAIVNTLELAVASGIVCVLVGFIVSYGELRSKAWMPRLLAILCVLPVAVPGLVYGLGLHWVYLRTPIYGSIGVLLLAYVAKFLPFSIMISRTGILQIHPDLEKCARVCGAGPIRVLVLIAGPLIKGVLATVLFFVMLLSIKELSASVLLYTARSETLAVMTWAHTDAGEYQFAAAVGVIQSVVIVALVFAVRAVFKLRLERSVGNNLG